MRKKLFMLLVVLSLTLLLCSTVFAAEDKNVREAPIYGLGTVIIPANVEFSEVVSNGTKMTVLLVNDNNVWRSIAVFSTSASNVTIDTVEKSPIIISSLIGSLTKNGGRILKSDSALSKVRIGDKEALLGNYKMTQNGFVCNTNLYVLPKADGVAVVIFMSSDGDAQYWQSIITKLLISAKE